MYPQLRKQYLKFDDETPTKIEFENAADTTGFWFAAAVLFAVLAAGIIVYRAANSDIRVASSDITPAAVQLDPISPASLLPRR